MPDNNLFCFWDESDIRAVHDQSLIDAARKFKGDIDKEWALLRACMLKYPNVFEERTVNYELFLKVYAWVGTRCFDLQFGRTGMIPMADNYNHLDQEIQVTLINKPEHLNTSATSPEFIREKFMNDYSIVFKEELE